MRTFVRAAALMAAVCLASAACSSAGGETTADDSQSSSSYQTGCTAIAGPTYALHGTALLPDGPETAYVVVSAEHITGVVTDVADVPSDAKIIETGGVIAPGLIDLHNHVAYDFIPFWNSGRRWSDRYQWARASAYSAAVKAPYNAVKKAHHMCEAVKYGEFRALAGGTTTIQGSADLTCTRSWVRNVEFKNFCKDEIRQDVLPVTALKQSDADALNAQFANGKTKAFFIHLAEGTDDSSRAEFDYLEQIGLVKPQVVAIHATALDAPRLAKMGQAGMKIVWSPLSNLALYGQTTDIPTALADGITVSIAPDWSPSGSANVLAELKVADRVNRERFAGLITDRQLVNMVTINPAKTVAMDDKIGSIRKGLFADLVVVRGDVTHPYRALIDAGPADVMLTTVSGQAFYGAPDLVAAIGDDRAYTTVDACGEAKSLADTETTLPISGGSETLADIQQDFVNDGVASTIPLVSCDAAPEWAFH